MITGDHKHSAFAIAKELDIAMTLDECLSGGELDLLSDDELIAKAQTVSVFARVTP